MVDTYIFPLNNPGNINREIKRTALDIIMPNFTPATTTDPSKTKSDTYYQYLSYYKRRDSKEAVKSSIYSM